ncbi:uncharacterized protein UDID_19643 [Ustilago sp. UG-2017a]|nr:uncharacterized protein UDID_19643 [Ustilago sp. UG-2017a]
MTQASTSVANFGLLLVALALILHSVVGGLTPRHVRHHLFARRDNSDECHTDLAPNFTEYEARCGDKSDSKHTCFTHWAGDLTTAEVCPLLTSFDITKELKIKDAAMKDFTIDKPTDTFEIRYPNHGGVRLQYWNFDPNTGCKNITVYRGDNSVWRIWVSDEVGNDRDLDTLQLELNSMKLCSKWIHIHIKRDGGN